ncbi:hypothetical protein GJ496_008529 [Pomphorhynchus laevis]|nr:hypothetical protein GJ496_008529 [Pomphorhynchus laevis]
MANLPINESIKDTQQTYIDSKSILSLQNRPDAKKNRCGNHSTITISSPVNEENRRKLRLQRFVVNDPAALLTTAAPETESVFGSTTEHSHATQVLTNFSNEDDKKKRRLQRFGQINDNDIRRTVLSSSSVQCCNIKSTGVNIEDKPKSAVLSRLNKRLKRFDSGGLQDLVVDNHRMSSNDKIERRKVRFDQFVTNKSTIDIITTSQSQGEIKRKRIKRFGLVNSDS